MATMAEAPVATHEAQAEFGKLLGIPLPMVLRTPVPLSDAELMAFSSRNELYRMERNARGEIEIVTPVGGKGSRYELMVATELANWASEHGGECFSSGGGFHLADDSILSPDAAWISASRWEALSEAEQESYPPLCPDFLMEVRSKSDSRAVLERKMETWIANGARMAWMIDPYAGTVSIYRPGRSVEVLERPEVVEADAVVPGFRLRASRLWVR